MFASNAPIYQPNAYVLLICLHLNTPICQQYLFIIFIEIYLEGLKQRLLTHMESASAQEPKKLE